MNSKQRQRRKRQRRRAKLARQAAKPMNFSSSFRTCTGSVKMELIQTGPAWHYPVLAYLCDPVVHVFAEPGSSANRRLADLRAARMVLDDASASGASVDVMLELAKQVDALADHDVEWVERTFSSETAPRFPRHIHHARPAGHIVMRERARAQWDNNGRHWRLARKRVVFRFVAMRTKNKRDALAGAQPMPLQGHQDTLVVDDPHAVVELAGDYMHVDGV